MANYTRNALEATAEAFDGAQATAEDLVEALAPIVSIQKDETNYPALTGANTLGVASTGVTGTVGVARQVGDTANVITVKITHGATASGNLSLVINGAAPVLIAVLDTDNTADKVATKVRAATVAGWTITGATDEAILTQDADPQGDAILAVLNEEGEYLNAYKDTYIVIASGYNIPETTTIWSKTAFEAYWTAAGA